MPLERALRRWRRCIGPGHILSGQAVLASAETATFRTRQRIPAILRPADRAQVQACLRIAGDEAVALYPVSGGKNWGFGSRVPVADGSVLLDLGRLNRVLAYDPALAYVTVEPGVTQRQLETYLVRRGRRLWLDPSASSGEASILGNILDRGHGLTPYGDHAATACDYEVALADGSLIRTGFGRFPRARCGPLDRFGVGPSLDGLFSQSNLGVVTRLTVWLMPAPEHAQMAFGVLAGDRQLAAAVDRLRPLRLDGTLRAGPLFRNEYRVIENLARFDGSDGALEPAAARRMARRLGFGIWNVFVGLYGSREAVALQRREVNRALSDLVGELSFLDRRTLPTRGPRAPYLRRIFALSTGEVGPVAVLPYWRKRIPVPAQPDPDRDRCGFYWVTAVAPNRGSDVVEANRIARRTILDHRFEPAISANVTRERAIQLYICLTYDRDAPGHDAAAERCQSELSQRLLDAGFPPCRVGIGGMQALAGAMPAYDEVLQSLKSALDPAGVIAPGRYAPATSRRR